MSEVILHLGDCIEIMKGIPDGSVDLCVTSPPYNLGIDYNGRDDHLDLDKYYDWCSSWMTEIYRVLKDNGRFALNHYLSCGTSTRRFAPLMTLNEIAATIGFKHHGLAVWDDITLTKRTAWGSWLSASAPYINSPYEGILILHKGNWNIGKGQSDISKEEFMESTSGVWKLTTERNRTHPAPFPVSLPMRCIKLLSFVGATVLDPFMGSGTTMAACIKTNRNGIGIEIDEEYYKLTEKRIAEVQQQMLLPLEEI